MEQVTDRELINKFGILFAQFLIVFFLICIIILLHIRATQLGKNYGVSFWKYFFIELFFVLSVILFLLLIVPSLL